MKKVLAMVLVLFLTAFACALAEDASFTDVQAKGYLILGLDDAFPPMGYNDANGDIVGFDIDLARAVCARLGVELSVQPIDWAAKETLLNAGSIDCIWNGMSITAARQESMAMTEAYLNNRIVILTKAGSNILTAADLAGKYVGTQSGSFAEEVITLAEYGYADVYASLAELKTNPDYLTAITDLKNDMVDAVLIDEVVARYQLALIADEELIVTGGLCDDLYGIGFRKADIQLKDAVWNALIALCEDGTAAAISNAWFGEDLITPLILK